MASSDQQKQKVKEHLARSLGTFSQASSTSYNPLSSSDERKRRVMEHIRLSKG
ncbi:hypothetical protein ACL6C3_19515 [Capilliphycus salinus ALCB114379]|uniref:hypothetical protein n=1 Tax=Capilliphycus salinus TaxID=2768948 RepID=UPI0039A53AEA